MDYTSLKQLGQQINVTIRDLIALSPNNDPFYLTPARQESGAWFKNVWHGGAFHKVHIRRVHYWLVSQEEPFIMRNGKPYQNTEACWKILCESTKSARYMDLVPIENFIDKRNPPAIVYEDDSEKETGAIWRSSTGGSISFYPDLDIGNIDMPRLPSNHVSSPDAIQRYQIEIWCEKSTMNDVLEPICRWHDCNLITGLGELSITAVDLLFDRIKASSKPTRVFYISDFDPAGKSMPVAVSRKAEFMAQEYGVDLVIDSLLLTEEQCIAFDLPRTPIKDSELRKTKFEANHGVGATELDALEALHPGALKKLVTDAVLQYRDTNLQDSINAIRDEARIAANSDQRRAYAMFSDQIKQSQATWEQAAVDINAIREKWRTDHQKLWMAIAREMNGYFHMDCPEAEYTETPNDVLFNSERDYLEQMDAYREFQKRPPLNLAENQDGTT